MADWIEKCLIRPTMRVMTTKTRVRPWLDSPVGFQKSGFIHLVATSTEDACFILINSRVARAVSIVTQGAVLTCRIVGHPALPVLSLLPVAHEAEVRLPFKQEFFMDGAVRTVAGPAIQLLDRFVLHCLLIEFCLYFRMTFQTKPPGLFL
jgi:hypothetical protein